MSLRQGRYAASIGQGPSPQGDEAMTKKFKEKQKIQKIKTQR
jgi:hypothetical protein